MRVLFIGLYAPAAGLSRVITSLASELSDTNTVHVVGLTRVDPIARTPAAYSLEIVTVRGRLRTAMPEVCDLVHRIQPHVVVLVHELRWMSLLVGAVRSANNSTRVVAYIPFEGRLLHPRILRGLEGVDCCVLYTEFARKDLERNATLGGVGWSPPRVEVLPHGVDPKTFHPLAVPDGGEAGSNRRRIARERIFPGRPGLHDAFVVLNGNRPYVRKRLDLTVRGFAKFAHGKPPNVRLCLHHPTSTSHEWGATLALAKELGVADRLILDVGGDGRHALSEGGLNLLYNACDVGINTSMGEGWGLVSFEHAATCAAQIVPRHGGQEELWLDAAGHLDVVGEGRAPFTPFEMLIVSDVDVANQLEGLYADPQHLARRSFDAMRHATRPDCSWAAVASRWDELLRSL